MNTVGVSTVVFSVLMAITGEHFVIEVRTVEPPIADPPNSGFTPYSGGYNYIQVIKNIS